MLLLMTGPHWLVLWSLFILPALSGPVVHLQDGSAEGISNGSVGIWRGIPFASPPVGDLRWRPPQPPAKWRPATLNAKKFANDCIQLIDMGTKSTEQMNGTAEDCLYINVYAPLPLSKVSKPVFLWIHGGGFQGGGSSLPVYDGTPDVRLSDGKLIIATFNYRLNVFGFAASKLLRGRDPDGGTGNYGILDQRLAMKWVRDNIAAFGGDASRVTIVGESAGANSVANHLVRRNSWGLFAGAGMESGAFYTLGSHFPGDHSYSPGPTPGNCTVADQESKFIAFMKRAKCTDVACLLKLPAGDLLKVQSIPRRSPIFRPEMEWPWEPTIDGVDLIAAPPSLAIRGELAPVPVLVGSNMEDSSIAPVLHHGTVPWPCNKITCNATDFWQMATKGWGFNETEAKLLVQLYGNEEQRPFAPYRSKWHWAAQHAGTDAAMTCASRRFARWMTQIGQSAFWYYWTYAPEAANRGACHACEIPHVFLTSILPSEVSFSKKVASYWSSFVASGIPNPPGLVTWPHYSVTNGSALIFGDDMSITAADHFLEEKCDFWDRHFREQWNIPQQWNRPSSTTGLESMIVVKSQVNSTVGDDSGVSANHAEHAHSFLPADVGDTAQSEPGANSSDDMDGYVKTTLGHEIIDALSDAKEWLIKSVNPHHTTESMLGVRSQSMVPSSPATSTAMPDSQTVNKSVPARRQLLHRKAAAVFPALLIR